MLSSRISVGDHPGVIAVGLFPYGSCMAQLVEGLEEVADAAPGVRPSPTLSREARDELDAIPHTYPLALGAVVRASSPGCSASGFRDALANTDRDCADGIASIVRGSTSGSSRVADLLGRLSCRPGAPESVLAAAAAASRRVDALAGGGVGVAAGIFSHGSALRRLASDTARAGASAANLARRWRAAAPNAALATRFWVDAAWRRRVLAGGLSHAPLRRPLPPTELVTDEGPALGWARATSEEDRPSLQAAPQLPHGGAVSCWKARCDRLHGPRRRCALCSTFSTFEFVTRLCLLCGMCRRGVPRAAPTGHGGAQARSRTLAQRSPAT